MINYTPQPQAISLKTHRSVSDLDLELGVLFADNRKLDPDVATLGPPEQAFLEKFNFRYDFFGGFDIDFTSLMRGKVDPSAPLRLITTMDP